MKTKVLNKPKTIFKFKTKISFPCQNEKLKKSFTF